MGQLQSVFGRAYLKPSFFGDTVPRMQFRLISIVLVLLTACRQPEAPVAQEGGLTADQFVELYVGLRELRGQAADSVAYEQQKAAFFKKHGATAEAMQKFVTDNSGNLTLMTAVWNSVQTRINRAHEAPK